MTAECTTTKLLFHGLDRRDIAGRFFSGHYKCYCDLLLYVFSGDHLLFARLRSSNRGAADGVVEQLKRVEEKGTVTFSRASLVVEVAKCRFSAGELSVQRFDNIEGVFD